MKLAEKLIKKSEGVISVVTKVKKTGEVLATMSGTEFMKMLDKADIKSSIGSNASLPDYIKAYNKAYPENIAEIK